MITQKLSQLIDCHRLASKKFRYPTRSSLYVYALTVRTNVWDLNSFSGLFVCSCMVTKINLNRNTLWNSVLKKRKSTTHLFPKPFLSLSFILLISGWYEFLGILYFHYFLFFQQVLSTLRARWNYYYLIYPCKISENNCKCSVKC